LNKREKRLKNEKKKRIVYLCLYEENSMNENEKDKIYERKGSETERNGEREESSEENELEKRDGEKGRW